MSLNLTIKNIDKIKEEILSYPQDLKKIINNEFQAFGDKTKELASRNVPVNEGALRESLSSKVTDLEVRVGAYVDYAAFVEFGTKSFAAEYVSSLPPDWQAFASEFRGKGSGGGNFMTFFYIILEWVQHKGFAASYSVKSHKRSNSKDSIQNEYSAAYLIALSILRNGIKEHPFLFPAYEEGREDLIKNLNNKLPVK